MSARTEEERIAALEADIADLRADFESFRAEIRNEIKVESTPVETEVEPDTTETPPPASQDKVEIPIYLRYKRKRYHDATLFFDVSLRKSKSRIRFEGEVLGVTNAARKAVQSINPKITNANGWWLWKLTDPDGNERHIGELHGDEGLRRRMLGMD